MSSLPLLMHVNAFDTKLLLSIKVQKNAYLVLAHLRCCIVTFFIFLSFNIIFMSIIFIVFLVELFFASFCACILWLSNLFVLLHFASPIKQWWKKNGKEQIYRCQPCSCCFAVGCLSLWRAHTFLSSFFMWRMYKMKKSIMHKQFTLDYRIYNKKEGHI